MRIGPSGNGDCSGYSPGSHALGRAIVSEVRSYCDPVPTPRVPLLLHGGSANLAISDGRIACVSDGYVTMRDLESLAEVDQHHTVVRRGWPGWDFTWLPRPNGNHPLSGHSVPAGLASLYWFSGMLHVRPGGDVGSSVNGMDWIRVSGEGPLPPIRRGNNQREFLGVAAGNEDVLVAGNGHGFGRSTTSTIMTGVVKVPSLLNRPTFLSTADCHYVIAPFPVVSQMRAGKEVNGFITWSPGIQVNKVYREAGRLQSRTVFATKSGSIPGSDDGSYHPQPWCLSGGKIYIVVDHRKMLSIDTSDWSVVEVSMLSIGTPIPRIAAVPDGAVVLLGRNMISRPGRWSTSIALVAEMSQQNQQFCNHLAVDDSSAYVARLISGKLVISQYTLAFGSRTGEIEVPIEGADLTGRVCDFFVYGDSLYALVTPSEPTLARGVRFRQFIVRVAA